ncbi:MAG: DMT family transporter [Thermoanaerobaculaceae bacterium]
MSSTAHHQPRGRIEQSGALPIIALVLAAVALSVSAIFVRWAAVPGVASAFWRMAIASSVMAWPAVRELRATRPLSRRHVALAALAGLLFAGDLASWNTGVLVGSAANATLLANTSAIWVALGSLLLFRERLRPAFWGGLALAMSGAAAIVARDLGEHTPLASGDLLGLLAGLFYGAFFLPSQRARQRLGVLGAWWVAAAASAVSLLAASLVAGQPLWGYPIESWLWVGATALVTQVGGYMAITYALGHLRASLVSPVLLLQPVLTALLAVPLLGEDLTGVQVGGGLLVLAGIALVKRSHR